MRVLRNIANRVYLLWSHTFLRLKSPARYAKRQFEKQVEGVDSAGPAPKADMPRLAWLNYARRCLLLENVARPVAQNGKYKRSTGDVTSTKNCSTGQALILSPKIARRTWLVTLLAVLLLATCFGQRFYRQPELDVRSISPKAFYAPAAAEVEDKKATEIRRDDVRNGSTPILRVDPDQTTAAKRSLRTLLDQGRELREQAGRPNFLNLTTLSQPTQDYLFQASEAQWRKIWRLAKTTSLSPEQVGPDADLTEADNGSSSAQATDSNTSTRRSPASSAASSSEGRGSATRPLPKDIANQVRSLNQTESDVLRELLAYRDLSGLQGLVMLQTRVDTRRKQYLQAYEDFIAAASTKDQPLYNSKLFELSEGEWIALESSAEQIFDEMMLQGINPGVPEDVLRRAIEARVLSEPSKAVRELTADVLAASIAPNLVVDDVRTRQQAEQAVRQIDPITVSINKGELIVDANEEITASDFVLLDYFGLTNRYFNWVGLSGFALFTGLAVALYLWVDHRQANQLNQRDHFLVILLCLVVSVLAALRVPTIGLPAVGLLVGSFYGSALGMTVVGLLTLMLPIGTSVLTIPLIAGAVAAMLGTWIAPQLRSREEFALLGGFVGLSQAGVHLVLTLMRFTVAAPLWKTVFVGSAMHGLYGIAWSVVALGVSPYLEHFFDVVTPIRLAELANPNRPLLKRLAAEAPGTFQHTMFVANLAEAAARALGRNVELVRAGTLYHDIGKMHAPLGFIENQMGGPNMHDALNDPWKSASIIKKHVTQGLVMARQYRLPLAVQAFIPEHQGDMKISYFYQQAKERQEKEPSLVVNPADFSYDGPIPQSPETGITMLADSCEAALRSLKPDASMDEAYAMVNRILRARWRSRQLIDSGLTRENMDTVAGVFVHVWQQHNHKRIAYPKKALAE